MARVKSMRALLLVLIALLYVLKLMSAFQKGQVWLAPEPGELRRAHPPETVDGTEDFDFNIVIVPEIGTARGKRFNETQWKWLSVLEPQYSIKSLIMMFEYEIDTDGFPIWQSLAEQGVALPNGLLKRKGDMGIFERPLIFIAHGLGGNIVKKALTFLHGEQYNSSMRRILEVHRATIFLGTPHPTYKHKEHWQALQHILRSSAKFSKKSLIQAEQEAAIMAYISLKYEEAAIHAEVLSAFETEKTKISGGVFGNRRILVDAQSAEMKVHSEKLVAVPKNHRDISAVDSSSNLFKEIMAVFQSVVKSPFTPTPFVDPVNVDNLAIDDYHWVSTIADPEMPRLRKPNSKDSKEDTKDAVQGTIDSSHDLSSGIKDLLQARPAPKLPCQVLGHEEPIQEFTGRLEILEQIEIIIDKTILNPTSSPAAIATPRSFALFGTPGVGKTRLAFEYMHKHKDKFDAVFWVQADSNNSLADSYLEIAKKMEMLHPSEFKDVVIARNVVMEWLSNPLKQEPDEELEDSMVLACRAKWLLVFDNADDLDILGDYWPETGPGAILITSRNPSANEFKTDTIGYDLQSLPEKEASALLRRLANTETTDETVLESRSLANRLGNLPLALSQVAALIKRKDMKFSEFLEVLNEEVSQKELLLDESGYSHTLSTIWRIEKLLPSTKSLLNVLSLLDRGEIQDSLFGSRLTTNLSDAFPTSKLKYYDARDSLLRGSLIQRNRYTGQILIHPLLQTATRAKMSPQELQNSFSAAVNMLVENWPEASFAFSHETETWQKAKKLAPHVIKMADEYDKNPNWNISLDAQRDLAALLQKGGWHVAEKGNFVTAERMWNISLDICQRNAETMPTEYADALFCSGSHMTDTNQFKSHKVIALKHFEQRMKIENNKPSLGLGAGMAHSEMALAHLLNDEYSEAIGYSETSRKINENTPPFLNNEYWPFFSIIHHALALVGLKHYKEAAIMVDETIRWRENKYGIDDTESFKLGYALQVMGQIRQRQGRDEESAALYNRSLDNYLKTIGGNHHRTGHVLVKIAEHEARVGHVELADDLYNKAIAVFSSHSHYDPELARTTFKRAELHRQQDDQEAALKLFGNAQILYRKVIGSSIDPGRELILEDFDRIVAIWAR